LAALDPPSEAAVLAVPRSAAVVAAMPRSAAAVVLPTAAAGTGKLTLLSITLLLRRCLPDSEDRFHSAY
jgi:hypothetical protein